MNIMRTRLFKLTLILLFIVLFFFGLVKAATVLKPLAVSVILTLLLIPVVRKLEKHMSHGLASFAGIFIIFLALSGILGLISFQAAELSEDWDTLKERAGERVDKVQDFVMARTGLTQQQLDNLVKDSGVPKLRSTAQKLVTNTLNSFIDLLLILIYTFLLIHYRSHFKTFILKLVDKEDRAENTLEEAAIAVQGYLKAKFTLIVLLAVVYSVGLTLMGVKFGIFYGILAALLSIIPYVGNIVGITFPLIMAIIYNDTTTVMLVIGLFSLAQLLENYILQPLLVKKEVDLHPFFSISFAVIGGAVWGVTGMIIAIPSLAILYIIFKNIQDLDPYAYLLSEDDDD